jgi:hypothetical protein
MRVRADQKFRTYVNGTLLRASEGSVWEGAAARAMLATRCPVTVLEDDPAEPEEDPEATTEEPTATAEETDESEEAEGVPDGNVSDILEWVGDDKDRAREALDSERGKERPRASLVKQLTAIAE